MAPEIYVMGRNGKPALVKDAKVFREVDTGGLIVLAPSIEEATHGAAVLVQDQWPSIRYHRSGMGITGWFLTLGLGLLGMELVYRLTTSHFLN